MDNVAAMTATIWVGIAISSYLLGSIPTGFLWAKARGIDIRSVGSGNIGATNVMRALGKGPGITVLLIDAAKGFVPVFVAPVFFPHLDRNTLQILCCICVIAGHNWTCWLKFKGGKGVATSAGADFAVLSVQTAGTNYALVATSSNVASATRIGPRFTENDAIAAR